MKYETKSNPAPTVSAYIQVGLTLVLLGTLLVLAAMSHVAFAGDPKIVPYFEAAETAKINVNLLHLQWKAKFEGVSAATAAANTAMVTGDHGVTLDIVTTHLDPSVQAKFEIPGVSIRNISVKYNRVSVVIDDLALLDVLAKIPEVRTIAPEYGARTQVGDVTSRAVEALRVGTGVGTARDNFGGVDGSGQTVGILSDSFARTPLVRDADTVPAAARSGTLMGSRPQDSEDLPATIDLRFDGAFDSVFVPLTDEGAAMAELVTDIAPGVGIAFYTAFVSKASFATGITDLCTPAPMGAGATVVVDDVIYFTEPMYQDGIIAQAAAACVAGGVPYFSSAGNAANLGYRQTFADINIADDDVTAFPPPGNDLHDWGDGDGFLDITVPPGAGFRVVLQWNQPFDSVSKDAGSQIDMNVFVTDTANVAALANPLGASLGLQGTTGEPAGDAVETTVYANTSTTPQTVYVAVDHFRGNQTTIPQDAATPVELRLVFFDQRNLFGSGITIQGITDATSAFGGPTIYGHAMADGVTSVAAVPWFDTPVFGINNLPTTTAIDPEDFTARGGTLEIQFNSAGAFILRTSDEPDISAVDGNNTTFFGAHGTTPEEDGEPDDFPNFFGTSAAAPNAAAVAALIRQLDNTLTPAAINTALESTAIDVTGFRAEMPLPGDDDVTGPGLIDANEAIDSAIADFSMSADLAVEKSASPTPATVGNNLTYTITAINNGPHPADNVMVTDTLPAGVTFVSATPSQGTCSGTTMVTCDLSIIGNGGSATVALVVTPTATNPTLSNTARISGSVVTDPDTNNSREFVTAVVNPAPTVSNLSPAAASPGAAAFSLTVSGTNFVNGGSTVQWNGTDRTTTFVSSTQLRADIAAADVAAAGNSSVAVMNAAPGGGLSNLVFFGVVNPVAPPGGGGSGNSGGCFIATAAYGTPMAVEIRYLRAFRDGYLLTNRIGRRFVELYYAYSPPIADYISQRDWLRAVMRTGLTPLVALSKWLVGERVVDSLHYAPR